TEGDGKVVLVLGQGDFGEDLRATAPDSAQALEHRTVLVAHPGQAVVHAIDVHRRGTLRRPNPSGERPRLLFQGSPIERLAGGQDARGVSRPCALQPRADVLGVPARKIPCPSLEVLWPGLLVLW